MLSMQRPLPSHADRDLVPVQDAGEVVAGELAALVGVEDLGPAVAGKCFLQRLDAKIGTEGVRQPPQQHRAAHPIHDDHQVQKALAIGMYVTSAHHTRLIRSIVSPPRRYGKILCTAAGLLVFGR
jgi:hypothetical protein